MFIDRLSKKEFEDLVLKFFKQKDDEINSFNHLHIVQKSEKNIIIASNATFPNGKRLVFNDFYAEYTLYGQYSNVAPVINKSDIIRDYFFIKFGEEYLNALKDYLDNETNKKIEKMKKENERIIKELNTYKNPTENLTK